MIQLIISIIFLTILYHLVYLIDFVKKNRHLEDKESIRKEVSSCIWDCISDILCITIPLWGREFVPEEIWKILYLLELLL